MQPNEPNQQPYQPDYSVDYLNEIAGPQQATGGPSKVVMILAAVVGVLSIVLFLAMILGGGPSSNDKALDIYLRLDTLKSVSESQQEKLRDNGLRATNSALTLQLTNALSDSSAPLAAVGVDTEKVSESKEAKEATYKQELLDNFDDADLNVQLDATYAREMEFQLATLRAMMESSYRQAKNETFKTYLDDTAKELAPFAENLGGFQPY